MKHGEGVLKGNTEYFKAVYNENQKNGPYLKRIGKDYEEKGEYLDDELHGIIEISKNGFKAKYRYEHGQKVEDIPVPDAEA